MKIAVSAKGPSLQDLLDPSFGRCIGFVIYDETSQTTSFLDNSRQKDLPQAAGTQAAQMLSETGVDVLITGQIGPKAMQVLSQASIQLFSSPAVTIQEAIESWQRNELIAFSTATGQTGSGQGKGGGRRGRGPDQGGRGMGGGAKGRGPGQGGQGLGGGGKGKGPGQGGRGKGGGGRG